MRRAPLIALALAALLLAAPGAEAGKQTTKKGIWGPVRVNGVSQFPIYRELGAGVYHTRFRWRDIALSRPARPRDPRDPAYAWPAEMDDALRQARRYGMRVAVEVQGVPGWANGGREGNWVPTRLRDYADFMAAAVRRYPSVRYWVVWAEPTRSPNWRPIALTDPAKPLTPDQMDAPHRYAKLLNYSYGAIKSANPRALVVGGNTFVGGDIGPLNWIRNLRLPSGRPPRMDLYGHHPFGARRPDLSDALIRPGQADFGDLDAVAKWVDRNLGRAPDGRRLKLWLGEWLVPSDHYNSEWGWWVSRETQASWLRDALRITRRWDRIESLSWLELYDQAPRPAGDEMARGLLDAQGGRKPAFWAFKNG